jgi:hypothetical protein
MAHVSAGGEARAVAPRLSDGTCGIAARDAKWTSVANRRGMSYAISSALNAKIGPTVCCMSAGAEGGGSQRKD